MVTTANIRQSKALQIGKKLDENIVEWLVYLAYKDLYQRITVRYQAVAVANCDTPDVCVIRVGYCIHRTADRGKRTLIEKCVLFHSTRSNWTI